MEQWPEVRIGDLGEVFTGRTPPTERRSYFGTEFPFITPGDMHQGKYARETGRRLSQEGADLLKRIRVPAQSVCVSCIGWQMGEVVMTDRPSFTNQQINTIVPNDRVDPSFLFYSLRPRKQELLSLGAATGVRTPILNKSAFCDLKLKLPPLPVQRRLAGILSAYDELIENSHRRMRLLEAMARALYREWFVHFRFPGHDNYRRVASSLGGIPEGWQVSEVGRLAKVVLGGTPSRSVSEYWEGGTIPWLNSGKLNDVRVIDGTEFITPDALLNSATKLMPPKTVLVAITGAILVSFLEIEACANQSVVGVYDTRTVCQEYLHIYFSEHIPVFESRMSGSAQQHINKEIIERTLVLVPPHQIADAFREFAQPTYEEIRVLLFTIQNLRRTRDLLLVRLLSGEVKTEKVESRNRAERGANAASTT